MVDVFSHLPDSLVGCISIHYLLYYVWVYNSELYEYRFWFLLSLTVAYLVDVGTGEAVPVIPWRTGPTGVGRAVWGRVHTRHARRARWGVRHTGALWRRHNDMFIISSEDTQVLLVRYNTGMIHRGWLQTRPIGTDTKYVMNVFKRVNPLLFLFFSPFFFILFPSPFIPF